MNHSPVLLASTAMFSSGCISQACRLLSKTLKIIFKTKPRIFFLVKVERFWFLVIKLLGPDGFVVFWVPEDGATVESGWQKLILFITLNVTRDAPQWIKMTLKNFIKRKWYIWSSDGYGQVMYYFNTRKVQVSNLTKRCIRLSGAFD